MSSPSSSRPSRRLASLLLIGAVVAVGMLLAAWKHEKSREAERASANQPEPVELVTLATAEAREHRPTTTAIGTVLALRSVTLRNELAGTVRQASLTPGQIVEAGTLLVALDVSEEGAELKALQAQANLAQITLEREERLFEQRVIARELVDRSRAQRDVTRAEIERLRAVIAKKTIRAPFRARVGLADVHPGQYLNQGVELTTLQGVSADVHVDFGEGPVQALRTAVRFMKEGGAHAVKLEGGRRTAPQISAITGAGIPVMGHVGFTPQSEHTLGGYRVQGRGSAAEEVIADARAVAEAGAFAVVLEMVPGEVAKQITKELAIPTVGIGAGPDTDAQVLVWQDMAGLRTGKAPRFVKRYADLSGVLGEATRRFADEVRGGEFPAEEHTF